MRAAVTAFTPVIQARAARVLARHRDRRGRGARQELADLAQDILALLFRDDARILRGWHPERGLSLLNYVGLVAEREVAHTLASGRRSPWALDPAEPSDLERASPIVEGPSAAVETRDLFDQVVRRLREELSPKGLELFRLLVIEEASVDEVCAITQLSADTVYVWKSRLLKRVRALLTELEAADSSSGKRPSPPIPDRSSERT